MALKVYQSCIPPVISKVSVLGPLLFIIRMFINDLPCVLVPYFCLQMMPKFFELGTEEDYTALQNDLKALHA